MSKKLQESLNTKTVRFDELPKNLQDELIQKYLEDDMLDYDWWEPIIDGTVDHLEQKIPGLEIDKDSIEFDYHYNSFDVDGQFDPEKDPDMMTGLPKYLYDKDILDGLTEYVKFHNDEVTNCEIYSTADEFLADLGILEYEDDEGVTRDELNRDIGILEELKAEFKKQEDMDDEVIEAIDTLIEQLKDYESLFDILFTDKLDSVDEGLLDDMKFDIQSALDEQVEYVKDTFEENVNYIASEVYDELKGAVFGEYEYLTSEEHAKDELEAMGGEYEVIVDEKGKIIDFADEYDDDDDPTYVDVDEEFDDEDEEY